MDPKTHIIKSKSSNSATARLTDKTNKCRSNAAFQPYAVKKRGVYVEKKLTNLSIHNTDINQPTNTDQSTNQQDKKVIAPKTRPGRKKFLGSVLTILSKSTTGTQYPDELEKAKKHPVKSKPLTKNEETSYGPVSGNPRKVKPKKFRSKVLYNIEANKDLEKDQDQLLVLKSRKDIIESPSNYSGTNSFRLPEVSSFIQNNNNNLLKNDFRAKAEGVAKGVLGGKKLKTDKKVRIDDPITLVEGATKNKQVDKIYDFFVDLLETTFTGDSTKGANTAQTYIPSSVSSNHNLEIDESVLEKLNIKNNLSVIFDDVTQKHSSHFCCVKEDNNVEGQKLLDFCNNTTQYREKNILKPSRNSIRKPVKTKLMTQSFINSNSKRSFSNTSKKKTLLNEFKEQLKMDLECFEEPQNLYQALKVIARNKRKRQKALHFTIPNKYSTDANECMLKRRKIITPNSKLYNKKQKYVDELKLTKFKRNYYNINSKNYNTTRTLKEESNQSLKVFGYDYDTAPKDVLYKPLLTPKHSNPMISQTNVNTLLNYTDSELSKHLKSISQNLSFIELHS